MSYATPLIEYMHTLSSQSNTKESCAVLPLHDRDLVLEGLYMRNKVKKSSENFAALIYVRIFANNK